MQVRVPFRGPLTRVQGAIFRTPGPHLEHRKSFPNGRHALTRGPTTIPVARPAPVSASHRQPRSADAIHSNARTANLARDMSCAAAIPWGVEAAR